MSGRRSRNSEISTENQDSNSNGIVNIITSNIRGVNTYANDGSFLELFKKKMQESKGENAPEGTSDGEGNKSADEKSKKNVTNSVSKRRGGKILKTGMVKKQKTEEIQEETPPATDAWARYMAEVKKYRQQACDEDGKTRPLVK